MCEIDALSEPTNENPVEPVAMLMIWPITPPCTTATTSSSG